MVLFRNDKFKPELRGEARTDRTPAPTTCGAKLGGGHINDLWLVLRLVLQAAVPNLLMSSNKALTSLDGAKHGVRYASAKEADLPCSIRRCLARCPTNVGMAGSALAKTLFRR